MAGIQLTGLASGMDWKNTVDQLMKIEQIPQDSLKSKKAAGAKLQSAYDTLKTNLTALQTAATALQTGLSGYPRNATISAGDTTTNVSGASVSSASGATVGAYTFNVTSLGKASSLAGGVDTLRAADSAAGNLKLSDYGVSEGTFTVNGTQYTISSSDLSKTVSQFFALTADPITGNLSGQAVNGNADANFTAAIDPATGVLGLAATGTGGAIGAAGDTSNLLSALGLAYSAAGSSNTNLSFVQHMPTTALARLTLGDLVGASSLTGSGDLSINGVSVGSFDSSSTLGSVISAINSKSETGVTASVDALSGRLILTANSIGGTGLTVVAGAGLDSVLGLASGTFTRGNAITYDLSVNGSSVGTGLTSDSTTIDISKYGYGSTQLSVSGTGKYNVQVSGSGAAFKSKISTFISAYNSLKQMLDDSTRITVGSDGAVQASVFSNRSDINNLLSSIRSRIYTTVSDSSVSSSYDSASKIGLGFDSSGLLSITDSAKLDAALANSPSSVDALLNLNKSASAQTTPTAQQGIATRINNLMTALTGTSGLVATATASITSQSNRLQRQIEAQTRSLAQTRKNLEAGFIAMEKAQSKYQSMTQQLTAAFK